MVIISGIKNLPITKEQFNNATIDFIFKYNRLPFLPEDDLIVEIKNDENELELKPYRANKYVKEFYETEDNMVSELLSENILTYELIEEVIGIKTETLKNIISGQLDDIDNVTRICVENFFNKDYFPKINKYAEVCSTCKNTCKQKYNIKIIQCNTYVANKIKEKKKK